MGFVMILYCCRYFLKPKGGVSHTSYDLTFPSLLGYALTKKFSANAVKEAISSRGFSHSALEFVSERSKEKIISENLAGGLLIVFSSLNVAS